MPISAFVTLFAIDHDRKASSGPTSVRVALGDDRAVLHDDDRVGALEVVGLGLGEGVVEQLLERRAIDARVELRARPLPGRPGHARGLGGEGNQGPRAGGCLGHACQSTPAARGGFALMVQ